MFAALYLPPLPASDERRGSKHDSPITQLMTVAREFSPRVERLQNDLLTLDVSGLRRWFDHPRTLGEELRRAAADRSLGAHVAVAATRTAAVLAACGRAGLTVALPGEEATCIASLPIETLVHISDVLPVATLKRWGLKTLGDFASLPPVELAERLGQAGTVWQRLARGEDLQPLVPTLPDERYEESLDLEWPIDQLEPLSFVLGRLLDALCVRLEQADRSVAVLKVTLDLAGPSGRERMVRALQLPAPVRDARTLRTLALLDLESNPPWAAIDRVLVSAEVVEGRVLQFSFLERALPAERLSTLLARLSALMGSDRVGTPALVDSYRPGAFAMTPFTGGGSTAAPNPESRTPNPVPSALTDLPVVRRFRHSIPAHVEVQDGRPVRVTSGRRNIRGGVVELCAGPWRTSGEWWQAGWDRDEWEVSLRDGAIYLIFQDRTCSCGAWFIDGILD